MIAKLLILLSFLTLTLKADKLNVILILADDLAYNDLSCYGSTRIKTPNIDKLASEGIRFTSYYSGNSVCTPSRMALLTGSYPVRLGWQGGVGGYGVELSNGLSPDAYTLAEMFKDAGYATSISGKWHIGTEKPMLPNQQGFDSAYFLALSNNQTKKLYRDDNLLENPFENRHLSEKFTAEAIRFINENKEKPFFLYLPYTAPHFPTEAHPEWQGKSQNAAFGDVIEELDFRIGQLTNFLREQKLDEKTIIIFTSDNGTEGGQKKWSDVTPLRGLKWTSLEGGNRVPCIISLPKIIKPNQTSDKIISAIDLLPTLAAACKIDLKMPEKSQKIDGINLWDSILGKTDHLRNSFFFWDGRANPQAIRVDNFKLYFDAVKDITDSQNHPVLINLKDDPKELKDLSVSHPEKVAELLKIAREILKDTQQQTLPLGGPPVEKAAPKQPKWLK